MNLLHTIRTHTTPQALQERLQTLAHSPRNTRLTLLLLALLLYLPGIHSLPHLPNNIVPCTIIWKLSFFWEK